MRKLINRWTFLGLAVAATLVGVQHRLATLPSHPPILVSTAAVHSFH